MPVKNNTKGEINKIIPFLIAEREYEGRNIIKAIQYLYIKHYKTLLKEIKDWDKQISSGTECLSSMSKSLLSFTSTTSQRIISLCKQQYTSCLHSRTGTLNTTKIAISPHTDSTNSMQSVANPNSLL